jgi:hypothetical protein
MADQRSSLVTFPLNLGMDNVSLDEQVQPVGQRPRLVSSLNTRLTKVPGCVSKAPGVTTLSSSLTGPFGGVIPLGTSKSALIPSRLWTLSAADGTSRVYDSAVSKVKSFAITSYPQSSWYPAQVDSAGMLAGTSSSQHPPSCAYVASQGWTYCLTIQPLTSSVAGIYLNVVADDGSEVLPATLVTSLTAGFADERNLAAITSHGSTVVIWYGASGGGIKACTLTLNTSTLQITTGFPATLYTPIGGLRGGLTTQIAYDEADPTVAFVATQDQAVATSVTVLRVLIPGLTVPTSNTIVLGVGFTYVALAYKSGQGLLLATSVAGSAVWERELNPTTLATVWNQAAALYDGVPGCGFETALGTVYRVFSSSRTAAGFDSTHVEWRDPAGALFVGGPIRHQTIAGQLSTVRADSGDFVCYFPMQVNYAPSVWPPTAYQPTNAGFTPDPSVELYRMTLQLYNGSTTLVPSCVAHIGVDTCTRIPTGGLTASATALPVFITSPSNCISASQRVLVTYLAENVIEGNVAIGFAVRYAWVNVGSVQPRFALTADGATIIAGALTAVWDGSDVTEFGPPRMPKLSGTVAGGARPALTGTYLFRVIESWYDAQGQLHRGPPSNLITLAPAAQSPQLTITYQPVFKNGAGQQRSQLVVYQSEAGGTTLYAQPNWVRYGFPTDDPFDLTVTVDVDATVVDAFHPALYSDGSATQELSAFCPNASLDVAVIADRVWLLDAERPSRWWYSKGKAPGIFCEMSPDQYVDIPSNAGTGIATSEMNGNPLLFSTKGIWTVNGEGPDALLNPPFFSAPVQVSDVACTQRLSVVKTPAGVMFVSNNRFQRFAGQVAETPDIDATLYGSIVGTALFRKQQECAFFTSQGYAYVYNWQLDAWTLWDTTVTGLDAVTGCAQRSDGKVLLVGSSSGTAKLQLLNPESVSGTAQISLETGWIALGGPQDNNTLHDLVVHAKRASAHALTMLVYLDYEQTPSLETKAWTAADVLACVGDATTSKRYDVYPQIARQPARSIKLVFTESGANDEAFQPINATLDFIKNPGRLMQSMRDEARK